MQAPPRAAANHILIFYLLERFWKRDTIDTGAIAPREALQRIAAWKREGSRFKNRSYDESARNFCRYSAGGMSYQDLNAVVNELMLL